MSRKWVNGILDDLQTCRVKDLNDNIKGVIDLFSRTFNIIKHVDFEYEADENYSWERRTYFSFVDEQGEEIYYLTKPIHCLSGGRDTVYQQFLEYSDLHPGESITWHECTLPDAISGDVKDAR